MIVARGWKTTHRTCASRSVFSVSWGCRYYIDEVGQYVEMCYCSDRDGCNSAPRITTFSLVTSLLIVSLPYSLIRLLYL